MRINTNVMALNAQNKLTGNQGMVEKSIQRLSSGLRINGAADDASGLAISEKMRAQIRGLGQAQSNAQDGISLIQTAEGALQQTTDILQRMRELTIKAQNTGVLTSSDKSSIANELSTLQSEIDRIATSTTFNGKKLLDGSMGATGTSTTLKSFDASNAKADGTYTLSIDTDKLILTEAGGAKHTAVGAVIDGSKATGTAVFGSLGVTINFGDEGFTVNSDTITIADSNKLAEFKIGANVFPEDTMSVGIGNMTAKGLSTVSGSAFHIDISDGDAADKTLNAIDEAMNRVSAQRATLGVVQNRMEYAVSNLSTTEENLTAAESRIRDVDMAEEMVAYTKNTILNQSAMSMLAQANQQPQTILSLLQ